MHFRPLSIRESWVDGVHLSVAGKVCPRSSRHTPSYSWYPVTSLSVTLTSIDSFSWIYVRGGQLPTLFALCAKAGLLLFDPPSPPPSRHFQGARTISPTALFFQAHILFSWGSYMLYFLPSAAATAKGRFQFAVGRRKRWWWRRRRWERRGEDGEKVGKKGCGGGGEGEEKAEKFLLFLLPPLFFLPSPTFYPAEAEMEREEEREGQRDGDGSKIGLEIAFFLLLFPLPSFRPPFEKGLCCCWP